ncbi:valyl-trna synthetase [Cystoisospora suis]|uniref:valine--tRNA ligase n=1 Tax=Cystoisospora suis TaxID=483139 RepID=A0A2C6LGW8_9APIC|nr:valyl-trna synthetase [Cystoisospora suis]
MSCRRLCFFSFCIPFRQISLIPTSSRLRIEDDSKSFLVPGPQKSLHSPTRSLISHTLSQRLFSFCSLVTSPPFRTSLPGTSPKKQGVSVQALIPPSSFFSSPPLRPALGTFLYSHSLSRCQPLSSECSRSSFLSILTFSTTVSSYTPRVTPAHRRLLPETSLFKAALDLKQKTSACYCLPSKRHLSSLPSSLHSSESILQKKMATKKGLALHRNAINPFSSTDGSTLVMTGPMAAAYQPAEVEKEWYAWWERENFFSPTDLTLHQRNLSTGLPSPTTLSCPTQEKEQESSSLSSSSPSPPSPPSYRLAETTQPGNKFVMVIPPPNVTGSLHIGHALTGSIEDALARWNRMNGKVVLWVPGADHAGIATQSVVERVLMKEGKSRHDLGREAFVQKVWEWKRQYGDTICNQLRRIGSSVSWPHFSFTLDEKLSRAVVEAFVRLYDAGLIYREERLVSWSPFLKTAISDIEVDVEEIDKPKKITIPGFEYPVEVGYLWHFWYVVEGGGRLEVATTRIETMLGDVAVAVNPTDERYKSLIGKKLKHPFFPEREMIVVADEHVDASFGTGAVKITPAHDKNDFAIAKRHNLPSISVFTLDGKISEEGGIFAGQHRFECRFKIQQALKDLGLLGEKVPNTHKMQLPRCSRSGDIIEYMLIPQWWCSCKEMADKSLDAVRKGELQIVPRMHEETWFNWLENIKEWYGWIWR